MISKVLYCNVAGWLTAEEASRSRIHTGYTYSAARISVSVGRESVFIHSSLITSYLDAPRSQGTSITTAIGQRYGRDRSGSCCNTQNLSLCRNVNNGRCTTISTINRHNDHQFIINSSFPHPQKKTTPISISHQPSAAASQPAIPPLPSKVVGRHPT